MKLRKNTSAITAVRGFTMIEVLIAALVLAIGLLGLAGLQATGLKANHSAYLRTQATMYAYDAVDRMRANRNSANAGTYNHAMGAAIPGPGNIEQTDLSQWLTLVANNLPAGQASIALNGSIVTVVIQWDDSVAGGNPTETFTFETEL